MNNEVSAPYETNTLPSAPNARIAALRAKISTVPTCEVWQPQDGECLIGEYVGIQEIEHPKYGKQWQIFLKDENSNTYAVWANKWIRTTLKGQKLAIGDYVAITFIGRKDLPTGAYYNAYSIIVDKA